MPDGKFKGISPRGVPSPERVRPALPAAESPGAIHEEDKK